jgi:GNAT superfamily N-acetyltransferase
VSIAHAALEGYALREATPADAAALAQLLHAAFEEHRGKLDPPSGVHAETPESLVARMGKGGAVVAHAAGPGRGGALFACGFYEWRDGYTYIGRLGALPSHRGSGLGGALLAWAEERARAHGDTRARLATRVHWAELRRYYEARGYRAVAYGTHPGKTWPTWVDLEKDLVAPQRTDAVDAFAPVALDHVQLAIPRGAEDEARAFWIGVLGFAELPKPAESAGRGGAWFASGVVQVHVGVEDDFAPAKKAHPALRVRGLDSLRARLVAAGRPITPLAPLAGASRFHSADPFGNRIEFIAEIA